MDSSDDDGPKPGPSGYQNTSSASTRSSSRLAARSAIPIPAHRESTIALSSSEDEDYETKFESDSEDSFKGFSSVSSSSSSTSSSSSPPAKKKKVFTKKSARVSPKAQRAPRSPLNVLQPAALPQPDLQAPHLISQSAVATAVAAALQDLSGVSTEPITSFNCNFCNKPCFSMRGLDRHSCEGKKEMKKELRKEKRKQKVACHICGELFSASALSSHVACKHVKDGAEHICGVCYKKFNNEGSLKLHRRHCGDRFKCEKCSFATGDKVSFERHIRTHEKGGEWKCPHCELVFSTRSESREHCRTAHSEKYTACPNCGILFRSNRIKAHIKSCNKIKPSELPKKTEGTLFKSKGRKFPLSKLQMAMEESYAELMKKKLKPYELGEDGKWTCDDCGAKFDDEEDVDEHHDDIHDTFHH